MQEGMGGVGALEGEGEAIIVRPCSPDAYRGDQVRRGESQVLVPQVSIRKCNKANLAIVEVVRKMGR